jgi:hypothetical protein
MLRAMLRTADKLQIIPVCIEDVITQQEPGAADDAVRVLVRGQLYESRAPGNHVGGMPRLDADGLMVIPSQPLQVDGRVTQFVPARELCPIRVTVVEFEQRPNTYAVLLRQPLDDFMWEAGYPLPA